MFANSYSLNTCFVKNSKLVLVKKYVPTTKTEAELFSEESQIPVGHQFSRQFGEQMDGKISIDGGAPEQRIPNIIRYAYGSTDSP